MDICGDNRFEIIARAKEHLLNTTNIHTSKDEMKVLDDFLFRCWQMGWLDRYDRTCDTCRHQGGIDGKCKTCGSNWEATDEPQTPYDNCQSCLHWVYDGYWYCECNECRYEPKPQTDCAWK